MPMDRCALTLPGNEEGSPTRGLVVLEMDDVSAYEVAKATLNLATDFGDAPLHVTCEPDIIRLLVGAGVTRAATDARLDLRPGERFVSCGVHPLVLYCPTWYYLARLGTTLIILSLIHISEPTRPY